MGTLIATVFVASLLGSLHCAGMCGPFVALAVARADPPRDRLGLQVAYHGGRLVTYAALGLIAGRLGSGLDLAGELFGVQRVALVLSGAAMILFGGVSVLRLRGVRIPSLVPAPLRTAYARTHGLLAGRGPRVRAFGIGLASTLLPCGWLYAYVVAAAGTGSAALGTLTMLLFWLGTLPVMVGLGAGAVRLAGPLRRHLPVAAAVALVAVGVVAIAGRFAVPPLRAAGVREPGTITEGVSRVEALARAPSHCGSARE